MVSVLDSTAAMGLCNNYQEGWGVGKPEGGGGATSKIKARRGGLREK